MQLDRTGLGIIAAVIGHRQRVAVAIYHTGQRASCIEVRLALLAVPTDHHLPQLSIPSMGRSRLKLCSFVV